MEQITDDFGRTVQQAAHDPAALQKVWSDAATQANWRYKLFYGNGAFNRASVNAGLDALAPE